jgi:WD40 repeat protein/serine/threonine protein kinase
VAPVTTAEQFLSSLRRSGLVPGNQIDELAKQSSGDAQPNDPTPVARRFVRAGLLTAFQARCLAQGKWRDLIVANKYKVLDHLGVGGMGQVYLAEHLLMKRQVALKVLPTQMLRDATAIERFIREARALAALDHPNIVRAHDLERVGDLYMLVMEYVDGSNLNDLVADHGPRPVAQAAHYLAQAAQGLQHAHESGWVHRDIKPANLLVDAAGVVKVLDLGLAFLLDEDAGSPTRKYDDGKVLGTADYLAPEQAIDSHAVDIRADIYSLGATLYYLLSGRPPFDAPTVAQKLLCHQMKEPTPIRDLRSEVPEGLAAVLTKMMAKKPDARYQSPADVAAALLPFAEGADPTPPAQSARALPKRSTEASLASTLSARSRSSVTMVRVDAAAITRHNRLVKLVVATAALVIILGIGGALWFAMVGPKRPQIVAKAAPTAPKAAPKTGRTLAVLPAGERLLIEAHHGAAECVRVLGDGTRLVTCGGDGAVRVWDLFTGRPLRQLDGHSAMVRCVGLFVADSRLLLTASRDSTIRLWDVETGAELRRFEGHTQQVWWVDAAPDGKRLLSCGQDKTIRLWDVKTGVEIRQLLGHTDQVTGVAFLPNGKRAVSCGMDRTVRLWDVQTGAELKAVTVPEKVMRMAVSPDGRRALVGGRTAVHAWDLETEQVTVFEASNDRGVIEEGRFSPDGRWLLAAGTDGSVRLWDVPSAKEVHVIKGMKGKVLEVFWSPDGQSFWASGEDGTVRVWDLAKVTGAGTQS